MKPSVYIGIDPSYTAFAIVSLARDVDGVSSRDETELVFTPARAGEGPARLRHIYSSLRAHFGSLADRYHVKAICIEGYSPGSKFGREKLGELGGIARLALVESIPAPMIHVVPPTNLKKFVTGKGSAAKDDMKLSIYKKWGVEYHSHDLADAYGLARMAEAIAEGTDVKYEQGVLAALKKSPKDEKAA